MNNCRYAKCSGLKIFRANRNGGELIEVNPEETPLSRFATRRVPEPAAIALPGIVNDLTNRGAL